MTDFLTEPPRQTPVHGEYDVVVLETQLCAGPGQVLVWGATSQTLAPADTRQEAGVLAGAFRILDLKLAGFTHQPNLDRARFQIQPSFIDHFQARIGG